MKTKRRYFTLLEVLVSMAVFAVMMLGLMQFFSSAQQLWTATSSRAASTTSGRQALEAILTDFQNIYLEEAPAEDAIAYFNKMFLYQKGDGFGFGTMRNEKADPGAESNLTAVFYRKSGNVLESRTIADNQLKTNEVFLNENIAGSNTSILKAVLDVAADNSTDPWASSTDWEVLAENVAHFNFVFLSSQTPPLSLKFESPDLKAWKFPYIVQITLVLVDEEAAKAIRNIDKNKLLGSLVDKDGKITTTDPALAALLEGKVQVLQRAVTLERFIREKSAPTEPPPAT